MLEIVSYSVLGVGLIGSVFTIGYSVSNKSKSKNYVTKDELSNKLSEIHKKVHEIAIMVARIDERTGGNKK